MMNDAEKEFTAAGNPRPPSMDVYLGWIIEAWESLPKEAISKSFKDCGITVCYDGSEDDQIHCFKDHGPVPEGQQMLLNARAAVALEEPVPEERDVKEDEQNGYLSDQSLEFESDNVSVC